jgi:hypothetical protein
MDDVDEVEISFGHGNLHRDDRPRNCIWVNGLHAGAWLAG